MSARRVFPQVVLLAAILGFTLIVPALRAEAEIEFREGIVYVERDGKPLELDIAYPAGEGDAVRPAVLCIHGGAWRAGHRRIYHDFIRDLARRGYVAATASYRFAPQFTWPAQGDDVKAALDWLRAHASEYRIDKRRIGVTGGSAGGHLALWLGLAPGPGDASRAGVQAVVNWFGPADLRDPSRFDDFGRRVVRELAGFPDDPKRQAQILAQASPITLVNRGDAPVLTFHGSADPLVPVQQGRVLHAELTRRDVPNRIEVLEGRGHGWGGDDLRRTIQETIEYFDLYLKGGDHPLLVAEDFEDGAARWKPTDAAAWEVKGSADAPGGRYYSLVKRRSDYNPKVRSPYNYSLLEGVDVGDFVLDVTVRSTVQDYGHRDLCIFFGWQSPERFYYVHLGKRADAHAHSIFLVNDAPRVSIARERTTGIDWDDEWHRVRVRREVESGLIEVYFDDMENPVISTVDRTFLHGRVGIGSFDDTGDFDDFRLRGRPVETR